MDGETTRNDNVSKSEDQSPQSISLSTSDVETALLHELLLERLIRPEPAAELPSKPVGISEQKANTAQRKVKRERLNLPPKKSRMEDKLTPWDLKRVEVIQGLKRKIIQDDRAK